eukprot:scaffold1600_cov78-Cyclotella_meneghiniana.AAC.2
MMVNMSCHDKNMTCHHVMTCQGRQRHIVPPNRMSRHTAVPYRKRMKISSISPNGPMAMGMSA